MKWVDPDIKLVASVISHWEGTWVERTKLLLEQAAELTDYLSLHWYVGNPANDFKAYMATSELLEERLTSFEGLVNAIKLERGITRPIGIAVDEWNVWYRTHPSYGADTQKTRLEETYNLEDALVVAMQLNAFIRHARSVKMANIAQIVNVIAPVFTSRNRLVLQTIFYPFEIYRKTCGRLNLDIRWESDTFTGGKYTGVRYLDVSATVDEAKKQLTVYVVNRSQSQDMATQIQLTSGVFNGQATAYTVNGQNVKSENTFSNPGIVASKKSTVKANGSIMTYTFQPHSVTALVFTIG